MDRIHYAGETFVTGTAIAVALLDYARLLAERDTSDTVDVPTLDDDDTVRRTRFLIGPASQLASDEVESDADEIVDEVLLADIHDRTARLGGNVAVAGDAALPYEVDGLREYEL